jgi:hypothetical protein
VNVRRILVWLTGAVGVLLILLAVFLFLVHASIDSRVQAALETHGSRLAGARVVVGDVDISPQSGEGRLRDLRIENPPGFSRADAIRFGEVTLRIDVSTLLQDPLVIDEVRIDAPYANVELKPPGRSNIDVIRANLERALPKGGKRAQAGAEAAPASPSPVRRILIRKFSFEDGSVAADARAVGGKQYDATLPAVRLSNVGGPQGAPGDEVGQTVLAAFTRAVARSAARQGLGKLLDDELGGAGEAAKGLLDRLVE